MNIEVLDGGSTGTNATTVSTSVMVGVPLCPDLLRYSLIGAADTPRGRAVRCFFRLMQLWPLPKRRVVSE